jgi:hypothetical protein
VEPNNEPAVSDLENCQSQSVLMSFLAPLKGWAYIPDVGNPHLMTGLAGRVVLVLGVTRDQGCQLAQQFERLAFVWAAKSLPVALLEI